MVATDLLVDNFTVSASHAIWSSLAVARFGRFNFQVVTGPLHREQNTSIRFVSDQSQQSSVVDVTLGEGQSAISGGARVAHDRASRNASCRSGPAWRSTKSRSVSGTSRPSISLRDWISRAISFETSCAQCSSVLKATTRSGSLYCPESDRR